MEEPQSWTKKRQHRGGAMLVDRKHGSCPGFIVILQKARRSPLELHISTEVIPHCAGMPVAETVVEPLVVCVIEALLLQSPFEIPIHLCHEQKVRPASADGVHCLGPE